MASSFSLFSVPLALFSREEYIAFLKDALQKDCVTTIHTVNPEMLVDAYAHPAFARTLQQATVAIPDGSGIRYACLALQQTLIEIHPGVDTVVDLLDLVHEGSLRVAVCGARVQEHASFRAFFLKQAPSGELLCVDPGIIDERDPHVPLPFIESISAFQPHIVLVALGQGKGILQGKQERIVQDLAQRIAGVKIVIGVGGALDMLGGSLRRAPLWMRKRNLEWLYRFILQPWRFKRVAKAFLVFPFLVLGETLRTRTFLRALPRVLLQVYKDIR